MCTLPGNTQFGQWQGSKAEVQLGKRPGRLTSAWSNMFLTDADQVFEAHIDYICALMIMDALTQLVDSVRQKKVSPVQRLDRRCAYGRPQTCHTEPVATASTLATAVGCPHAWPAPPATALASPRVKTCPVPAHTQTD